MAEQARPTPGPWKAVDLRHQKGGQIRIWGGYGNHNHIANVLRSGCNPAADARLIAAAPDLYEALRWLVHLHHGVSKDGEHRPSDAEWREAIEAGKAALAATERSAKLRELWRVSEALGLYEQPQDSGEGSTGA